MTGRSVLLVVSIVAGCASLAQAETITFEDLAVAPFGNNIGGDRVSGGYFFDALADHTHMGNALAGADNGSTWLGVDDFSGEQTLTFGKVGGGAFSMSQLDISEWEGSSNAARQVAITGLFSGGGTILTTLTLDGIYGSGFVDFQTFALAGAWTNLTSVSLKGLGSVSGDDYFAIDNLVVADVPEPTTLMMFGLGFGAILKQARRRRTDV